MNLDVNDADFWHLRWINNHTGWDIGAASRPLQEYIDQLVNKDARILIPGCGNAYEAEYLLEQGFKNISLLDIAAEAVAQLKEKFKDSDIEIIEGDFFEHGARYDLILEQTFFCAIDTKRRSEYAQKAHELLTEDGKIAGVLFDRFFEQDGPPFGGNAEEYLAYFKDYFDILVMEKYYNSITPRAEHELFIILKKKKNENKYGIIG